MNATSCNNQKFHVVDANKFHLNLMRTCLKVHLRIVFGRWQTSLEVQNSDINDLYKTNTSPPIFSFFENDVPMFDGAMPVGK